MQKRIDNIGARMLKLEEAVTEAIALMKAGAGSSRSQSEDDVKPESENMHDGNDIMTMYARDAYAFGLRLLDMLFSKEELGVSLLFASRKSTKLGLDSERVGKLLGYINKRYGKANWDLKRFTAKANQKCRDSNDNPIPKPCTDTTINIEQ